MSNQPKPITTVLHPAMLTLVDDFVAGYMALRAGVTVDAARAKIESDADTNASYQRKMARMAILLAGPGGFALTKSKHSVEPAAPTAKAMLDIVAMMAAISKKPGADAA